MADFVYDYAKLKIMDGTIDFDSHTFKLALVSNAYTPSQSGDSVWNVASGQPAEYEITGSGYTAGGKTLAHVSLGQIAGGVKFDNTDDTDTQWTNATFTARYGVLYDDSTSPKYLIRLFDFGADKSVTAGTFTVQMNAAGILTLS